MPSVLSRPEVPKPLDFGNGVVAGSVARDGGLLVMGGYHAELGYATLDTAAPFSEARRHDPAAVRAYRSALATDETHALGVRPPTGWDIAVWDLLGDVVPHHRLAAGALEAALLTLAPRRDGDGLPCVVQRWQLRRGSGEGPSRVRWSGRARLGRGSMTQLTEGGVLPAPAGAHRVVADQDMTAVSVDGLDVVAVIAGLPAPLRVDDLGAAGVQLQVDVPIAPGEARDLTVVIALGTTADEAAACATTASTIDVDRAVGDQIATWRERVAALDSRVEPPARPMLKRALTYALECCAVPVDSGVCLITDHRILPLSWTRDAYYVALMLLRALGPAGATAVRRHLHWLFTTCERSDGAFARAYLPNGQAKDRAFQLDQQCYPLLELVDYVQHTHDAAAARTLAAPARELLEDLCSRRTPGTALFATEETPADDPLPLPYHFSSHVVLWHTLRRVSALAAELGIDGAQVERLAAEVRRDAWSAFVVDADGAKQFAYAVDAAGRHLVYHDANDLPTVLAPVWGFCERDDPTWRSTMDFAFSTANHDGYFPGPCGGLGSVHTPGAWPLGDVQELIYARLTRDHGRAAAVLDRLSSTACPDGGLPEARDPTTGDVMSRHWFAWPGAALALALLSPDWGN